MNPVFEIIYNSQHLASVTLLKAVLAKKRCFAAAYANSVLIIWTDTVEKCRTVYIRIGIPLAGCDKTSESIT